MRALVGLTQVLGEKASLWYTFSQFKLYYACFNDHIFIIWSLPCNCLFAVADVQTGNMVSKHRSGDREFIWINLGIIIAMSFGSLTCGFSASIISTTLSQPSLLKYFDLDTRGDATALILTMNGLYQVGGFLGVFTVSWLADKWGRRAAIGVSALITLI